MNLKTAMGLPVIVIHEPADDSRPERIHSTDLRGSEAESTASTEGVYLSLRGKPVAGTEAEPTVLHILAHHHSELSGKPWGSRMHEEKDSEIDGFLIDPEMREWPVQVCTGVPREFIAEACRNPHGVSREGLVYAVRAVHDAFTAKLKHYQPGLGESLILALDVSQAPILATRSVIDAYMAEHGIPSGFREVWLVGPSRDLTARITTEA